MESFHHPRGRNKESVRGGERTILIVMKPKLLIIHNRLVVGGPALDTIPLAYHLRNDFEIHILYGNKEEDETEPSYLLDKYAGLTLVKIASLHRSPHPIKDFQSYRAI